MRSWSKCVIFSRRMKSSSSVGPRSPAFSECWLSATGTPWFVRENSRRRIDADAIERPDQRVLADARRAAPGLRVAVRLGHGARAGDGILRLHRRAGRRRHGGGRIVLARLVGVERKRGGEIGRRRDLLGEDIAARGFPGLRGTSNGGTAAAHVARGRLLVGHTQRFSARAVPANERADPPWRANVCGQAFAQSEQRLAQTRALDAMTRGVASGVRSLRSAAWRAPRRCGRPAASGPGGTRSRRDAHRARRTGSRRAPRSRTAAAAARR